MRASILHVLAVLLIAAFAIGTSIPANASCLGTDDCGMAVLGEADGSCGQKSEPCKIAQNCAFKLQKMPAHASQVVPGVSQVQYETVANDRIASGFVPPETTPPRI